MIVCVIVLWAYVCVCVWRGSLRVWLLVYLVSCLLVCFVLFVCCLFDCFVTVLFVSVCFVFRCLLACLLACLFVCLFVCLVFWLFGCLFVCLFGFLVGFLVVSLLFLLSSTSCCKLHARLPSSGTLRIPEVPGPCSHQLTSVRAFSINLLQLT